MDAPQITEAKALAALDEWIAPGTGALLTYKAQRDVWAWVRVSSPSTDTADALLMYTPEPIGWIARDFGTAICPRMCGMPDDYAVALAPPGVDPFRDCD